MVISSLSRSKKIDANGKQKYRIVIDFWKLNEVTVDGKYSLWNVNDSLDLLGKDQYFLTLDLGLGFHNIELDPNDIEKTVFNVRKCHFEYGLKNIPATR